MGTLLLDSLRAWRALREVKASFPQSRKAAEKRQDENLSRASQEQHTINSAGMGALFDNHQKLWHPENLLEHPTIKNFNFASE